MQIRRTHNRDLQIVSQLTGCCCGRSGLNLKTSTLHLHIKHINNHRIRRIPTVPTL
ncbi:hypothetical protein BCR33DRAFT_719228 [Rhizoclosmatium globosum]|uniref:Uncharacterized protein n=1 Tax=Rhizoclosmatium globosum TaxID=329046 RepID=A0A1Y2C0Y1_9FUNG|nr:hypothetical protein BCR33DRAFT_719228 [Rhizoclosmatium globosum]|eukprot:ORY40681.1 hypothetical protein BCR33DRAFT_719228 [Rhizoclosmatium globosum]